MSMDIFRGVLGGMAEAHQAHNQNLLTQEMARRKILTDFWQKRSEDPNMRDEERDRATQMFLGIAQTPHDKKLAKQFDPPASEILSGGIAPQTGQSWMGGQTQREVETAPMPIPTAFAEPGREQMPSLRQIQQGAVPSLEAQPQNLQTPPPDITRVPMPQPPPGVTLPSRYTEGEQIARATRRARAQMDLDVEAAGRKAEVEEQAKAKYQYHAPEKPVGFAAGSLVILPDGRQLQVPFKPDDLNNADIEREIAFESYRAKYGLKTLTATQKGQALKEFKQLLDVSNNGEPLYPVMSNGAVIYAPRSQAAGQYAPRTVYDAAGNPTTGGVAGLRLTPPPSVDATTQANLSGWHLAINMIDNTILPGLEEGKAGLGPLAGRVTLAEVEKLGGYGATPQQIELAVNLRRLLMSQAFAEGGKQLTPTEKEEFVATNPALSDTFEQAITKARLSRDYLNQKLWTRVSFMPKSQSSQIPALGAGGPQTPQTAPPPTAPPGVATKPPTPTPTSFDVTDPKGGIHHFATQAQADAFKKAAGIK